MSRQRIGRHGTSHAKGGSDEIPGIGDVTSSGVAIWANAQSGGVPAFATTDQYSGGGTDDLDVFTTIIRGPFVTDPGDSLSLRCGHGLYIARATMFLVAGFDPATMLFDLNIEVEAHTGTDAVGLTGGEALGSFNGFLAGTYIREYAPVTAGTPPFEYIAQRDLWFVVPDGATSDVKTTVKSDTAGLTFVANPSGTANPGASNLSIVRVGD